MSRLLVFNPEHDYALAHGGAFYMAPSSIKRLSSELEFLPIIWSRDDDFLLLSDDRILSVTEPHRVINSNVKIESVEPWGWDLALTHRLQKLGIDSRILPSPDQIEQIRILSHRRISIECNQYLHSPLIPREFSEVNEALDFYKTNPNCYFKQPWSSGGRGVVATEELDESRVGEWLTGCIRKQGSVIAEPGINRVLDFSSLWDITDSEIEFYGLSVSISDGRGKYGGNLFGPQEKLWELIRGFAPSFSNDILEAQRKFVENKLAGTYKGKIGIDMMADKEGKIYPCVEINLRRTMGHTAIDYFKLLNEDENSNHWKRKCRFSSLRSIEDFKRQSYKYN